MKNIFYVIYISDMEIRRCLDTMRLVCDPFTKTTAHVTLRGPYKRITYLRGDKMDLEGASVSVFGVDRFVNKKQNTVYLNCGFRLMRHVWHKPEYPGRKGHLTLYDGTSRVFSEKLYTSLKRKRLFFTFPATRLEMLTVFSGQSEIEIRAMFDDEIVKKVTGRFLDLDESKTLSEGEKLTIVEKLSDYLIGIAK